MIVLAECATPSTSSRRAMDNDDYEEEEATEDEAVQEAVAKRRGD